MSDTEEIATDEPVDIVEGVPIWGGSVACYIVNGDNSGLEPDDKKLVDEFLDRLRERDGLVLVCPIEGTEDSFNPSPAFGLACDTVDYYARRVAKPWSDRDWEAEALRRAEDIGVYQYSVNDRFMEYWSFFGKAEGWYFIRYDLGLEKEVFRGANIPWDAEARIPAFLKTKDGSTLYNYLEG